MNKNNIVLFVGLIVMAGCAGRGVQSPAPAQPEVFYKLETLSNTELLQRCNTLPEVKQWAEKRYQTAIRQGTQKEPFVTTVYPEGKHLSNGDMLLAKTAHTYFYNNYYRTDKQLFISVNKLVYEISADKGGLRVAALPDVNGELVALLGSNQLRELADQSEFKLGCENTNARYILFQLDPKKYRYTIYSVNAKTGKHTLLPVTMRATVGPGQYAFCDGAKQRLYLRAEPEQIVSCDIQTGKVRELVAEKEPGWTIGDPLIVPGTDFMVYTRQRSDHGRQQAQLRAKKVSL